MRVRSIATFALLQLNFVRKVKGSIVLVTLFCFLPNRGFPQAPCVLSDSGGGKICPMRLDTLSLIPLDRIKGDLEFSGRKTKMLPHLVPLFGRQ